jgi:hypothetical protein
MEPAGPLLRDVDPEQYAEWEFLLNARSHSNAAHVPTEELTLRLIQTLPTVRVRGRCECAQTDCNTYHLVVPGTNVRNGGWTIRFNTFGEALLDVDDAGNIYCAERLIEPGERERFGDIERFELVDEQWLPVKLVNVNDTLHASDERETETASLEEQVAAYRTTLEGCTRDLDPLGWATTQYNLGLALRTLGEGESGTACLEDSVAAYRAALEERTRDRVPLDWALTQADLGHALLEVG